MAPGWRLAKSDKWTYTTTRYDDELIARLRADESFSIHALALETNSSGEKHLQGFVRFAGGQQRGSWFVANYPDPDDPKQTILRVQPMASGYGLRLSLLYVLNVEAWKNEVSAKYLHSKEQGEILLDHNGRAEIEGKRRKVGDVEAECVMLMRSGSDLTDIEALHPVWWYRNWERARKYRHVRKYMTGVGKGDRDLEQYKSMDADRHV